MTDEREGRTSDEPIERLDDPEGAEPSQEELDARDVAKAQNASPRQHQQGVDAIERLQDGDLEDSEQEALQDEED